MADTFTFELVTPEGLLLSVLAERVTVPGAEGDFGVMPRHAPVMSTVRPGVVVIEGDGEVAPRYFVRGGFAEVSPEGLTLLAEHALPLDQVDPADLDQQIAELAEIVASTEHDDDTRLRASDQMSSLRQVREQL